MPSPSLFESLKPLAGRVLETALNRALALDPETRAELRTLDGQRLRLQLEAPPLALELRVDGEALRVGPALDAEPDLGVRGPLSALLSQLPPLRGSGTPSGKLRIEGDAELARRLQHLARGFRPDWDAPFAEVLGPMLGPQVARVLREGLAFASTQAATVARHGADYLTEESRDLVGKDELNAFLDDVDALRDRVERAAARLAAWEARR